MNKKISVLVSAAALLALPALTSCTAEEPFGDGEGVLKMRMVVNSTLTRAEADQTDLADNCVVYLSGAKGLLYKYKGLDNVPSDIYLKSGSYVAEAWTGDSVSASFDKKFYRAYEPFTISKGDVKNVVLNCRIANVVASINPEPIIAEALRDYKVTVANTRGSLDFTEENAKTAHGYFMMPDGETSLTWTISGKTEDGKDFTKSGVINDVQRAHEYVLNIRYTPTTGSVGGGFITVTVDDTELLIEDTIELTGAPAVEGVGFDITQPLTGESGSFSRKSVYVESLVSLSSLKVKTEAATASAMGLPTDEFDFMTMTSASRDALAAAGVECTYTDGTPSKAKVTFSEAALNRLPNGEYRFEVSAVDVNGKSRVRTLAMVVSDASVIAQNVDPADVRSYSALLRGNVMKDDAVNPGFRYRKAGESEWTVVTAVASRPRKGMHKAAGDTFTAALTGLTPSTRYEYQAVADGYVNPNILTFTTESVFLLPNAGFEDWSTNSKGAYIPGAGGTVSFWDTGNHGSITMKKNVTIPVDAPVHSGSHAVKLASQFVGLGSIGKFAAGNLFAGSYDKTVGTNGELTFGRPFDGSRPVKLSGYIYYHPGTVDYSETSALAKGQTDIGAVYVALTSQPVAVKTASKELFDPSASYVIAYGALDLTSEYGSDSALRRFEITLDYKNAAQVARAGYIVLVASASKYGDYFTGSSTSVMVIDDLQLIYE